MPLRVMFLQGFQQDILDLYRIKGTGSPAIIRATMHERKVVMEQLEAAGSQADQTKLDEVIAAFVARPFDMIAFKQKQMALWNAAWVVLGREIGALAEWRKADNTKRRRKHNLQRCTVRTIFNLLLQKKMYLQKQQQQQLHRHE